MDDTTTLNDLKEEVQRFCDERDWDQFHDPLHLAVGASTEASELLDIFRFRQIACRYLRRQKLYTEVQYQLLEKS